jgi:hypothetical protein
MMIFRLKRSYFDGIIGGFAVGWAYVGASEAAAIEIVTGKGRVLASGFADLPRADVEEAGVVPVGGDCGFRLNIASELTEIDTPVSIYARLSKGSKLRGRSVKWRPDHQSATKGQLESIRGFYVEGWAVGAAEDTVRVTLFIDGQAISTVTANRFRRDLREAGYGNGCQGFRLPLPNSLALNGGKVWIAAEGSLTPLPGGPINVPRRGAGQDRMAIEGVLDSVDERQVRGWVNDGRLRGHPRQVKVTVNGFASQGWAGLAEDGLCRFKITLNSKVLPNEMTSVHVTDAESGVALSKSPLRCIDGSDEETAFFKAILEEVDNAAIAHGPQEAAELAAMLAMDVDEKSARRPMRRYFGVKIKLIHRLHAFGQPDAADKIELSMLSILYNLGAGAADHVELLEQLPLSNPDSQILLGKWLALLPEAVTIQPVAIRLRLRTLCESDSKMKLSPHLQSCDPSLLIEEADRLVAKGATTMAADLYHMAMTQDPDRVLKNDWG